MFIKREPQICNWYSIEKESSTDVCTIFSTKPSLLVLDPELFKKHCKKNLFMLDKKWENVAV